MVSPCKFFLEKNHFFLLPLVHCAPHNFLTFVPESQEFPQSFPWFLAIYPSPSIVMPSKSALKKLTLARLKDKCEDLHIPSDGTKKALLRHMYGHCKFPASPTAHPSPTPPSDDNKSIVTTEEPMTVADLSEKLSCQGLPPRS